MKVLRSADIILIVVYDVFQNRRIACFQPAFIPENALASSGFSMPPFEIDKRRFCNILIE
jgi:hypothetical protein